MAARRRARRWRTSFGLRVGDGVARLRRLYPNAVATRDGRVAAFVFVIGAQGE